MDDNVKMMIMIELTNNSDTFVSYSEMYNTFIINNPKYLNNDYFKYKLQLLFLTYNQLYSNIKHIIYKNEHYLMWSLDNNLKISPPEQNITTHVIDYIKLIDFCINNNFENYDPNLRLDNMNNSIHICINEDNIDLLDRLINLYNIDWNKQNVDNLIPIELAKKKKNSYMIDIILTDYYNNKISDIIDHNNNIKIANDSYIRTIYNYKILGLLYTLYIISLTTYTVYTSKC